MGSGFLAPVAAGAAGIGVYGTAMADRLFSLVLPRQALGDGLLRVVNPLLDQESCEQALCDKTPYLCNRHKRL